MKPNEIDAYYHCWIMYVSIYLIPYFCYAPPSCIPPSLLHCLDFFFWNDRQTNVTSLELRLKFKVATKIQYENRMHRSCTSHRLPNSSSLLRKGMRNHYHSRLTMHVHPVVEVDLRSICRTFVSSWEWKLLVFNQPICGPRIRNWPRANFEIEIRCIHGNILVGFQSFVHGSKVSEHRLQAITKFAQYHIVFQKITSFQPSQQGTLRDDEYE